MPDFEHSLAALTTIRCPGCIAYFQCGSVASMPVRQLERHLELSHGWTRGEVILWLDTGRRPTPAHRDVPGHE